MRCLELSCSNNKHHSCVDTLPELNKPRGTSRPTWLATTASCGSSGSAAASRACNDRRTVLRVIAAALKEHPGERYRQKAIAQRFPRYKSVRGRVEVLKISADGWRLEVLSHFHLPLVFEYVQTYGPCDWANVGMPDLCYKSHLRKEFSQDDKFSFAD